MRIALLHSYYSSAQSSGENVVVDAQFQALSAAGHDVMLLGRRTDTEQALSGYQVRAAWRTLTNRGPNPFDRLRRFEPDVVHVHNTVPNIGLTWLPRWRGPVVHTLHNFRPLCANGLLFRDGRVCTDCPDGRPWSAVEHGCYRHSALASTPIAARNSQGVAVNPLLSRADALIVLSAYARDVFTRYGVDRHKVHLLPNGVRQIHAEAVVEPPEQRWIAVGRLRAEKGFVELLRGWPDGVGLDIAGTGPQRGELEALAGGSVRFLGKCRPQNCAGCCRPTREWSSPAWLRNRRCRWWWWRRWKLAFRWQSWRAVRMPRNSLRAAWRSVWRWMPARSASTPFWKLWPGPSAVASRCGRAAVSCMRSNTAKPRGLRA